MTENEGMVMGLKSRKDVIEAFCNASIDDTKLLTGENLKVFSQLDEILDKKCFVGISVKHNSIEESKQICFCTPDGLNYVYRPNEIDGKIADLEIQADEVSFRWDPINGVNQDDLVSEEIIDLFQNAYGPKGEKYNILGDIYHNALHLTGECFVWIRHLDYDIDNDGKYLSFVFAVCESFSDRETIKGNNLLMSFIMLVKARYLRKIERQRQIESVKSAVAAIISRNMSHNLGSHYLYYTKNQLAALADSLDEKGPEIRGAAKVLGYMQARMDYLATIVAGDKYPYGSVFFKGQIFDELTIDDFSKRHFQDDANDGRRKYKRTTNFLLQNLILSENFTRDPVVEGQPSLLDSNGKNKRIRLQIRTKEGLFTGSSDPRIASCEEEAKLAISKLCIALPGGIMSIHAFYNVVENLIRNSAKYRKNEFKENDDLVFTITINEKPEEWDQASKKLLPARYEFVIFDNKANALKPYLAGEKSTLLDWMTDELAKLTILNENNEIEKNSKGLKEMLFSTLWMRSYTYEKSKYMSDILAEMDRLSGVDKLKEIRQHAFEYLAVDDEGNETKGPIGNLGIRFELPKYRMMENAKSSELDSNMIEKGLNNFTDILCVDSNYGNLGTLKTQFTRVHTGLVKDENSEEDAVMVLRGILRDRFPDFDKYRLCMEGVAEEGFDECDKINYGIFFKTHLADRATMRQYVYSEAISGENFTKTMQNIFNNGVVGSEYIDKSSEYFGLKIKEAALTKITLIDERLFNDMQAHSGKSAYLMYKNIRVLNLINQVPKQEQRTSLWSRFSSRWSKENSLYVDDLFEGNRFSDGLDVTHFLSIHLGMIEKIVKDDSPWIKTFKLENADLNERVDKLMAWLRKSFANPNGEVFISVHSGRGNFSPDLDKSLKHYPFISISALESVYSNSKFLLAQLFYNTVYIGKGVSNE